MKKAAKVYLLIGGNIGDKWRFLEETREEIIDKVGDITAMSKVYLTEPWGVSDQPWFLNQALEVATMLSPQELLKISKNIERAVGGEKQRAWGERKTDIDILFYEDAVIDEENLKIPHPQMQHRNFVLLPLADIAPEKIHPVLGRHISMLVNECEDTLQVKEAIKDEV